MPNIDSNFSERGDDDSDNSPEGSKVLSFDAYGNLTAPLEEPDKTDALSEVPSVHNSFNVHKSPKGKKKKFSAETPEKKLSEKEIRNVVKSGIKSEPISRYGRNRKKRSADGFVFGTIDFNELRKVSPPKLPLSKRNKSLTDQNSNSSFLDDEDLLLFTNGDASEAGKPSRRKYKKKSTSSNAKRSDKESKFKELRENIEEVLSQKEEIEEPLKTGRVKLDLPEERFIVTSKRPTECRKRALLSSLEEDVNIIKSSLLPEKKLDLPFQVNGKEKLPKTDENKDKKVGKTEDHKKKIMKPEKDKKMSRPEESKKRNSLKEKTVVTPKVKRPVRKASQGAPSPVPTPEPNPLHIEEELPVTETVEDNEEIRKKLPVVYLEGDLVWVYIKGNPMWPALVTCPASEISFTKLIHNKKLALPSRLYHVLFLNDGGRTLWVRPNCILEYEGKKCLFEYLEKLKECNAKNPHPMVKTLQQKAEGVKYNKWQESIIEADSNVLLERKERTKRYNWFNKVHTEPKTLDRTHTKKKVVKRKRDSNKLEKAFEPGDSDSDGFEGFDDSSSGEERRFRRRKLKEAVSEGIDNFLTKNLDLYLHQNPGESLQSATEHLMDVWKDMTYLQKARFRSKPSSKEFNFDTDYSSDSSSTISRTKRCLDISKGSYKLPRNEKICQKCFKTGDKDLVKCKGICGELFHIACVDAKSGQDFKCEPCVTNIHMCFVCKSSDGSITRCTVPHCSKFYHIECARKWPQVYKSKVNEQKLVCPRHMCHTCSAKVDDMNNQAAKTPPYTRCIDCPTTYHSGETCIAAGAEEFSSQYHKCTKHLEIPKVNNFHCNINWCFCCSKGGQLLLCDQCPAAFHAECLNITTPEGAYVCEDCENGKVPLYGDIVWVKVGNYRWWPGQVLHPKFIPDNIENLAHKQGMFCVHFFGSDDYFWVSRGRVFLYQEGDQGSKGYNSKTIQAQFRKAMDEVVEAYQEQKNRREFQEMTRSLKGNKKPAPWVKIDVNKPVGNVRPGKLVLSSVTKCDCSPFSENPCGSDNKCLNRMVMIECIRDVCAAGDRCNNQRFQKRQYPDLCYFKTPSRGWGLQTKEFIAKGEFIIEYVGELVDEVELKRRIEVMHEKNEENYYFLTIDKDHIIDAGPKGNLSRFMNHSCHPNCETQKWTVGPDTRVGLFAMQDIPANSELTFNYHLECVGTDKKKCNCGGLNCSGFIGAKVQKNADKGKLDSRKKKRKKKKEIKSTDDTCFRCGLAGDLVLCDQNACPKGYHLHCLGLSVLPKGKWVCPWHHCDECGIRSYQRCSLCPNSYCRTHTIGKFHEEPHQNACIEHLEIDLDTKSDDGTSHSTSREPSPDEPL